jgi:nitroreductase
VRAIDVREARELATEAARAPSVHNVQPARWRFLPEGEVLLFRDLARALPAADPSGHDVALSMGAGFEGMALALSKRGIALVEREIGETPGEPGLELVARAALVDGAAADPLADWVPHRRAFRGVFAPVTGGELASLAGSGDVRVIADRAKIRELAARYDRSSLGFLRQPAYLRELYDWCRFSRRHPRWDRDGLNADCLALSTVESIAASWLLRPRVFAVMRRMGLGGLVISEAAQIRSAAAVVLLLAPRTQAPFAVGRRFYRLWLEITALGLALVPMSALADDPAEAARLAAEHGVPATHRVVNAFRVGKPGPRGVATSPRLPVGQLLV